MTEPEGWSQSTPSFSGGGGGGGERYLVMVARLGSSLENSSPDFPPWRQSWVTGQLGPLVILVLSWSSQPAQPGPGQDTSVRQSGPWQSSTQPHLTSPVTHSNTPTLQHSILKQISYSGEIWWIGNLRILLLLLGISGHWSVVISHWKIVEG